MASQDETWIQHLFLFHTAFAVVSGAAAVLYPSIWHVFFTFSEKGDSKELLNAAIQLYGSLIVGQAVLVYTLRSHMFSQRGKSTPFSQQLRQRVCLAYTIVFTLSFAFVTKAQIMGVMNFAASLNSLLFISLASAYGMLFFRSTSQAPKRVAL